jgi:hypothetical protein
MRTGFAAVRSKITVYFLTVFIQLEPETVFLHAILNLALVMFVP